MTRPYTQWVVTHPEVAVRIVVPARSAEEARAAAWKEWYRRPVRTGFDEVLRDAFGARDTGIPAEPVAGRNSGKANTQAT